MVGLNKRENQILELLKTGQDASVSALSKLLEVSVVTVRADLKSLEEKGMVVRSRGGAVPAFHPELLDKMGSRTPEKERIAQAAANLVQDGDRLMITNGTTSALVGRYIFGKRNLQVVTNSMLLLPYGRVNPNLHLTIIGGEFRPTADALVGPEAIRQLDQFHVRMTITGTDGFTLEHGMTTHLVENAEMVRKMVQQAEVKVLVVDSSKYGNIGFVNILPLSEIDILISDEGLPENAVKEIRNMGIELIIV
ncbi:MAG: DeoR/GlpR family DNA-binding transcription regulator [Spirochaetia bacterium]|nr:DeoR/GlpR family DNA-binding transcription regulator [Spirochaetia bacterium]